MKGCVEMLGIYNVLVQTRGFDRSNVTLLDACHIGEPILDLIIHQYGNAANVITVTSVIIEKEENDDQQ